LNNLISLHFIQHNVYYSTNDDPLFTKGFESHHVLQPHHVNGLNGFVDSLRVEIPIKFIDIVDPRFNAPFIECYPQLRKLDKKTGEVIEYYGLAGSSLEEIRDKKGKLICHQPKPDRTIEVNGITYRFYFRKTLETIKGVAVSSEVCVIQISAKMVKSEYFNGITKNNISYIIDDINSFNIINIDLKTLLLYGKPLDIDICINSLIDDDNLNDSIVLIESYCPHKRLNVFKKKIKCKNDIVNELRVGFEYGNRHIKNMPSSPFCKLYHKGKELLNLSNVFFLNYLNGKICNYKLDRLVRIEGNVLNSKHKKRLVKMGYKANWKNLNDLLETPSTELANIVRCITNNYVGTKVAPVVLKDTETPSFSTFLLLWLLKVCIEKLNFTKLDILEAIPVYLRLYHPNSKDGTKKTQRCRATRFIDTLFAKLNEQNDSLQRKLKKNDVISSFLRLYGFNILDV